MMIKKTIIPLFILIQIGHDIKAQNIDSILTDSLVSIALSLSEKALYDTRLDEAKDILNISYFKKFKDFNYKHEILLTILDIRIDRFISILYLKPADPQYNFKRLVKFSPLINDTDDHEVLSQYFLALSNSYYSIGKIDSAMIYQEKAIRLFQNQKNYIKLADIRALNISREHNKLLREGKKKDILGLIPKYEEEIAFSKKYSKYTLSYNTRHLAQIHRRQTNDYKEALRLFKTSLELRLEIGFLPFIPASYSSVGDVYFKMEKYTEAIEMYSRSIELAEETGFIRYQTYPNLQIGDIYLTQKQKDQAFEFYTKALKIAANNNYSYGINQAIEKIKKMNASKK